MKPCAYTRQSQTCPESHQRMYRCSPFCLMSAFLLFGPECLFGLECMHIFFFPMPPTPLDILSHLTSSSYFVNWWTQMLACRHSVSLSHQSMLLSFFSAVVDWHGQHHKLPDSSAPRHHAHSCRCPSHALRSRCSGVACLLPNQETSSSCNAQSNLSAQSG